MDNLKKRFILLVQTQAIVADIRWGTFQACDCLDDAIHVDEELLNQALEILDIDLCTMVEEFTMWKFERGPKPSWLKIHLESDVTALG